MKVLLVCLGNICRSPMAEGILRKKLNDKNLDVFVDSAGTGDYHIGENPDRRAIATAKKFGVDISKLITRQFDISDFEEFDFIFVMDKSNFRDVAIQARTEGERKKIRLILDVIHSGKNLEVPDPWYAGQQEFDEVFKLLDVACDKIVTDMESFSVK